jgi:hypothetical protein
MKKIFTIAGLLTVMVWHSSKAGEYNPMWQQVDASRVATTGERVIIPQKFNAFLLNDATAQSILSSLGSDPANAQVLDLPTPDGGYRSFRVWQSDLMDKALAARYPMIKTFTAVAVDNKMITAKLDYTPKGFHAMVYDNANTYFIDPYSNVNDGYYTCYYRHDYTRPSGKNMVCGNGTLVTNTFGQLIDMAKDGAAPDYNFPPPPQYRTNGTTLKKYRLALACTGEYATAVGGTTPTKASVLAAMIVSVNRVVGVYEREIAVTLQLIPNEDTLIFLNATTDPYQNTSNDLTANQTTCTTRIGTANFDMGHLFGTGGGGVAFQGCICSSQNKARGLTGSSSPVGDSYDIDYVAHEMGHQFGGSHTFNSNLGSCGGGNRVNSCAYEVGSGTTIMAYAGICQGDNTQAHSDAYFHAISLREISTYITTGNGNTCAVATPSGNTPNALPVFTAVYSIPYKTPFELTGPVATDATADTLTYCWEEWDLGDYGSPLANTHLAGPLFRSFNPSFSTTRVFPQLVKIINNTSNNGEKLPDTARTMKFKYTARDIYNGIGCFNFADDSIMLNVINTGTPFAVTNPTTSAITWLGGTNQTVTWDVSGTDVAPISTSTVDIYLSVDGGYTYPYTLRTQTANTGNASVVVPNIATTTTARVKVKGHGNVFFDISNADFTINYNPALPFPVNVAQTANTAAVKVYPIPASDVLHVSSELTQILQITIQNAVGQSLYKGSVNKNLDIPVGSWAKGVYYIQILNAANGDHSVRSVLVQ